MVVPVDSDSALGVLGVLEALEDHDSATILEEVGNFEVAVHVDLLAPVLDENSAVAAAIDRYPAMTSLPSLGFGNFAY